VHWRIKGRRSWGVAFCGGIDSVEGPKGGKHCCEGRTSIHRSVIESTVNHKSADNGKNTSKANGDATAWSGSDSEKKMHNPR
jgi:hypothetical protein